jgi:uncharacterized protein
MDLRDPHFDGPMQGSVTRVHGFLTSIVSGPMIMPSEWLPVIFSGPDEDDHPWESMAQAQRATTLVMRLYNEIASDLRGGGRHFSIIIDRLGDPGESLDLADDWCKGYALGIAPREDEWKTAMEAPELQDAFFPILALAHPEKPESLDPVKHPENYEELVDELPRCAVAIYEWWRKRLVASMQAGAFGSPHFGTVRRATPKISPKAPCPCGSGKKHKRCCSAVRAV